MSEPLRIAFDIDGVLSKYPDILRRMISALQAGSAQVYVITDMPDKTAVLRQLDHNGFGHIPADRVYCADYSTHGEGCKAELLAALKIDVFLDDLVGYVAVGGCPVQLLVMPDASRPYYADDWQHEENPDFCRRTYRRRTPLEESKLKPESSEESDARGNEELEDIVRNKEELRALVRESVREALQPLKAAFGGSE